MYYDINNMDDLISKISIDVDVDIFQLTSEKMDCYISTKKLSNNIKINYAYFNTSIELIGKNKSDSYCFSFILSKNSYKFNSSTVALDQFIFLKPNDIFNSINFNNFSIISIFIPIKLLPNYSKFKSGLYNTNSIDTLLDIKNIALSLLKASKKDLKYFENELLLKDNIDLLTLKDEQREGIHKYFAMYQNISTFIHNNSNENISIINIAKHFNISDRTLRNIFIDQMGISPKKYLNYIKLNKLNKNLKNNKNETVTSVILNSGFSNHSSTTKEFKKLFQILPKDI